MKHFNRLKNLSRSLRVTILVMSCFAASTIQFDKYAFLTGQPIKSLLITILSVWILFLSDSIAND